MKARVQFREADKSDIIAVVQMLADDPLGAKRERFASPLPKSYYDAYNRGSFSPQWIDGWPAGFTGLGSAPTHFYYHHLPRRPQSLQFP